MVIDGIFTANNINNKRYKDVNLRDLVSSYCLEESDEALCSCQINNAN